MEEEAESVAGREPGERRDLRHLPTVTIDGADAKDFDDAISVERLEDGYRLWVHIADVTHFVEPGGALDSRPPTGATRSTCPARSRRCCRERLSNDVCSLKPNVERAAVTAEMEVTPDGETRSATVYRSLIVSDARLTYEGVDAFLREEGEVELSGLVLTAYELSRRLKTRAARRGKLELGGREPEYEMDADGVPVSAGVRRSTPARELIEELMVLANESVARDAAPHGEGRLPGAREAGRRVAGDARREARGVGVQADPTPENLGTIAQTAKSDAVNYLILRSIPRALYSAADPTATTASPSRTTRTSPPRSGATPTSSYTGRSSATSCPKTSAGWPRTSRSASTGP